LNTASGPEPIPPDGKPPQADSLHLIHTMSRPGLAVGGKLR